VAVNTSPRYQRGEASLESGGHGWEFFNAHGFRIGALEGW
jgi:hypothetical protein